jgi:ribosome maturation factor RimP
MAVQEIVGQTVTGLGYDLVEIERSAGGLLRITIDLPWQGPEGPEQFITVEDCEKVTRQLQFALEVDGVEYKRLEVSSPGIDRPLTSERDYERFAGQVIDVTLKAPIGAIGSVGGSAGGSAAGSSVGASSAGSPVISANRKKFRGTLERVTDAPDGAAHWQIVWRDEPAVKPGQKVSRKRPLAPLNALGFELNELKEARLAPIVSFKGRGVKDDTPATDD